MRSVREISADQAITALIGHATHNREFVSSKFTEAARRNPRGVEALLKAASNQALGNVVVPEPLRAQARSPLRFQKVEGPGVPLTHLTFGRIRINLNLIPDFLRHSSGAPVELNADQAIEAISTLNGGVRYGDGYEKAVTAAMSRGEFKDGTLILARRDDLLKIAREHADNPTLTRMNSMIASCSSVACWCVSSTETPQHPRQVSHVSLQDGFSGSYDKHGGIPSRVVVLRGFTNG
jgi:hypothetical protein